jgi:hypothetical protein
VTDAVRKMDGKTPSANERLAIYAMSGDKTVAQDFSNVVGRMSMGEDFPDNDDNSLSTSETVTGLRSVSAAPICGLSEESGLEIRPASWSEDFIASFIECTLFWKYEAKLLHSPFSSLSVRVSGD